MSFPLVRPFPQVRHETGLVQQLPADVDSVRQTGPVHGLPVRSGLRLLREERERVAQLPGHGVHQRVRAAAPVGRGSGRGARLPGPVAVAGRQLAMEPAERGPARPRRRPAVVVRAVRRRPVPVAETPRQGQVLPQGHRAAAVHAVVHAHLLQGRRPAAGVAKR